MNIWLYAAIAESILLVIVCMVLILRVKNNTDAAAAKEEAINLHEAIHSFEAKLLSARNENNRLRERIQNEQVYEDELEDVIRDAYREKGALQKELVQTQKQLLETQQEAAALRMRIKVTEADMDKLHREARAQETLYQEMLYERDMTIERLQEVPKKKTRRRQPVLDQQVTLDEILEAEK